MAINLEMPKKLQAVIDKGHQGAAEMIRPISRKYDLREHDYPVELETLASLFEGNLAGQHHLVRRRGGISRRRGAERKPQRRQHVRGAQCDGDQLGRTSRWLLSVPYQGLGNAADLRCGHRRTAGKARKSVGRNGDHRAELRVRLCRVSTTAKLDGDEYVINGEKIFVTAGSRASHIVGVGDARQVGGRAAIKSFQSCRASTQGHG